MAQESRMLATSRFMQNNPNFQSARRNLQAQGINTNYNDTVCIFYNNHKHKTQNLFSQECNGLVLELNTWRPLVVPARGLRNNIDTAVSNKFLHAGLYHIYEATDGTCFNMYYLDRWIISTARGHTMNDMYWSNLATYQTLINECLKSIGLDWNSFCSQLDTSYCYTFGFRHPLMHKFNEGNNVDFYRIWFIQSVCTNPELNNYLWSNDQSPIAIISNQKIYDVPVNNLKDLYKLASSALENYIENKQVCYGFILRSANPNATKQHSDLFIESNLMRFIRKTWYDNELISSCHERNWDKLTVILLHSYLDTPNYETFTVLFPQFSRHLAVISEFIQAVVNALVSSQFGAEVNDSLVSELSECFKNDVSLSLANMSEQDVRKVFYDYVCHVDSLDMLMSHKQEILTNSINEVCRQIKAEDVAELTNRLADMQVDA